MTRDLVAPGVVTTTQKGGRRGKQVKNGALTSRDVKNNSLRGRDIKNGSLRPKDFRAKALPAGPTSPRDPQGERGPAGTPDHSQVYTKPESDGRFLAKGDRAADSALLGGKPAGDFVQGRAQILTGGVDQSPRSELTALYVLAETPTMALYSYCIGVVAPRLEIYLSNRSQEAWTV